MEWQKTSTLLRHQVRPVAGGVVISLAGELDCAGAGAVRALLLAALGEWHAVTVDLSRVTFVDARGLGALVAVRSQAAAEEGCTLEVRRPHRCVRRLLELTQLEHAFRIAAGAPFEPSAALSLALDGAIDDTLRTTGADAVMAHVADSSGALHLVAQRGFSRQWCDFFETVDEVIPFRGHTTTPSGDVLAIDDVADAPAGAGDPSWDVFLAEGSRAVAVVPVAGAAGDPLGVISVHRRRPAAWSAAEVAQLQQLAVTLQGTSWARS